jgi:hypothetical protein
MKILLPAIVSILFFIHQHAFAQLQASGDTTICANHPVQLSVSGGTTYTWSPAGSLSSATSATPVATPTQTTTYVVSSQLPNTNLVPNPDFSQGNTGFTSSYTYEVPTNVIGSGSYFVGGNATHWNPGMSNICNDRTAGADTMMLIANAALTANTPVWCLTMPVSPNCTYSLSGYYTAFNQTNLPKMQWMVNGTPVGSAAGPAFFQCIWNNFTATWSSGNNTTATFCIFDPVLNGPGNDFGLDDISIIGSGTAYDTVTVTVVPGPAVNFGNDTTLCKGSTIHLSAFYPGAAYQWSDGKTTYFDDITTAGTYSVSVTGLNGCSATDVIVIDSSTLANPVISTNDSLICSSDSAHLCVVSAQPGYVWNTGVSTTCINTSLAGNYWIVVTDNHSCTASSNHIPISVYAQPPVSISVNGDTLRGYNSSTYQWLRNGGVISGAIDSIYIATLTGSYTLQITDTNGCKATSASVSITTGIHDVNIESEISVFPNPNTMGSWELNVGEELMGSKIDVMDVSGKLVFQSEIRNPKSEIHLSASGIYFLRLFSEKGIYTTKLIKL